MEKKIIYIANDGKEFDDEKSCLNYENACDKAKAKAEAIQKEIKKLDIMIWSKYYPNGEEADVPIEKADIWLKSDIIHILSAADNLKETEKDIISLIKSSEYSEEILKRIEFSDFKEEVSIRRNYDKAFKRVKRGRELSHILRYSFGSYDLKQLALLHKANKHRRKIEDLLDDCNFHSESCDFSNKQYNEYTA